MRKQALCWTFTTTFPSQSKGFCRQLAPYPKARLGSPHSHGGLHHWGSRGCTPQRSLGSSRCLLQALEEDLWEHSTSPQRWAAEMRPPSHLLLLLELPAPCPPCQAWGLLQASGALLKQPQVGPRVPQVFEGSHNPEVTRDPSPPLVKLPLLPSAEIPKNRGPFWKA